MNVKKIKKKVLSSDGQHTLAGVVYLPEGEPRGLFHVAHGMREHIGRYDRFMNDMAKEGYIVFGYDHLGHGYTAENDKERGYFAKNDGWKYLVNDIAAFGRSMKKQYGEELPYILMGHSMGSFIVRIAAAHFDFQDKLILMGTGSSSRAAIGALALARSIKSAKGGHFVSEKIDQMVFGSYNDRCQGEGPYAWLSNDEAVRQSYKNDPFCRPPFTISAIEDLIRLNIEANNDRWYQTINKEKPIFLVSGSEDPVGNYGADISLINDKLLELGANVQMKIFDGYRHELLNDSSYDEVLDDIKRFSETGQL